MDGRGEPEEKNTGYIGKNHLEKNLQTLSPSQPA